MTQNAEQIRQDLITAPPASAPPARRRARAPSESAAILSIIERAASNPDVDIDKMERLLQMQERIHERNAKAAYAQAFAEMQADLPSIDRNGRIEIKDKSGVLIQSTPFADWNDINDAIKPILGSHGFSLSFRTPTAPDGRIRVTAILLHEQGHEEENYLDLQHDSTGSKNPVQAVGSTVSYGKRYAGCALLNITSRAKIDRDDDGHAAGATSTPGAISEDQVQEIQRQIVELAADIPTFCEYMGVASVREIPVAKYDHAIAALDAKRRKIGARQ